MSDSGNSGDDKSVVDRLLDAGLFAPLGFVLRRTETLDDLAAAGREQIAFTRSLGRAAIKGLTRGASTPASSPQPAEVDGYDELTAREIVALLATCDAARARWIQDRELGGKNRVTILRAAERANG